MAFFLYLLSYGKSNNDSKFNLKSIDKHHFFSQLSMHSYLSFLLLKPTQLKINFRPKISP